MQALSPAEKRLTTILRSATGKRVIIPLPHEEVVKKALRSHGMLFKPK